MNSEITGPPVSTGCSITVVMATSSSHMTIVFDGSLRTEKANLLPASGTKPGTARLVKIATPS